MTIMLYNNKSDNNVMKKELTSVLTMTGTLKESSDVINPTINFENENFIQFNYVYIPEFRRYYFLTKIESVRNKLWRMYLHVDVLMSFAPQILENSATVSRQEKRWNMYLDDGTFKSYSNPLIQYKKFPNQDLLNHTCAVLIVAGGLNSGRTLQSNENKKEESEI